MALSACLGSDEGLPDEQEVGLSSHALAYYNAANLWTATGGVIPVCWMTPGWALEKSVSQNAVEREWGRAANVSFVGWSDCPTSGSARYVKIQIDPDAVARMADGQALKPGGTALLHGPSEGLSVHFWFSTDHAAYKGRIEYVAVHEFGHVLGFIHEQDRPDAPTAGSPDYCKNSIEQVPVTNATGYDHDSIMNYCNRFGNNEGFLSASDVVGVQKLYGRKPTGALVGDGGLCANIWRGTGTNGTSVASFRCTGAPNDTWGFSAFGGSMQFTSNLNRCMLSVATAQGNGTPVVVDGCSGSGVSGTASWAIKNAQLIGFGNKCLDTSNGPNSLVVVRDCNGSPSQRWTYDTGRFLNGDTSQGQQCLDLVRASDVTGGGIASWSCTGAANQLWYFDAGGFLHPSGSRRVLDVYRAGTADGTPVYLWDRKPSDTLNQQWFMRSELTAASGRTLDVAGPASTSEGRAYSLWNRHGGPNQVFDYYP